MKRPNDTRLMAGGAVLLGAGLLLGASLVGALTGSPRGSGSGGPVGPDETSQSVAPEPSAAAAETPTVAAAPAGAELTPRAPQRSVSEEALEMAVEKAPFEASRQAPVSYLLPEERVQPRPVQPPRVELPPAPPFRVLGTVASGNGGIAVIEAPGEPPRVLSLGQEILGFRLSRIEEGRVVLGDDVGRSVSVAVPEVAPRMAEVETRPQQGRGQNQGRGGGGGRGGGAGGRGGAPGGNVADVVNDAVRSMRERTGGDVRMEMRGDRVILTAPDGTRREISIGGDVDVISGPPPAPQPPARPRRPGGGGQ